MEKRRNILLCLNWYHPKLHRGIADFAKTHHWHLNTELTRSAALVPHGWQGDGILCMDHFANQAQAEFIQHNPAPRVIITHNFENFPDHITLSDDHEGIANLAADHFLAKQFRHYAIFCPHQSLLGERVQQFSKRIHTAGYQVHSLVPPNDYTQWAQRRNWLKTSLQALPKPIAIFAQNDEFAAEVIESCMDAEIPIPSQIAICGVRNDELICESLHVPLTSVDNNLYGIGYQAAEQLHALMNGENPEIRHYTIKPAGLFERMSTDTLAIGVNSEPLQRALQYIRDHYDQPHLKVGEVASAAAMSRRKLFMLFEKHLQVTPLQEIVRLRLNRACQLLKETNRPLEEVASQSGFSSLRNFFTTFKKETGLSPSKFRTKAQLH